MGVDVQAFVIFGVKLPYDVMSDDDFWSDRYLPYIEGSPAANGFIIVRDGMSGKYVVAGKRIAASDQHDGHFEEPIKVPAMSVNEMEALAAKIAELFPGCVEPLSVIVVSHYH